MNEGDREDLELSQLLRSLDHDRPAITAQDVIARARRPRGVPVRLVAGVAAAIALAGVAYALPGSPVRSWVDAALRATEESDAVGSEETGERNVTEVRAGIVLDPAEALSVSIVPGSSGRLRIIIIEEGELVAQMISGEARFTSDPGTLSIELRAPDILELRIPRSAPSVSVIAAGRPVFTKRGRDISAVMEPDSAGRYILDLDGGPT